MCFAQISAQKVSQLVKQDSPMDLAAATEQFVVHLCHDDHSFVLSANQRLCLFGFQKVRQVFLQPDGFTGKVHVDQIL